MQVCLRIAGLRSQTGSKLPRYLNSQKYNAHQHCALVLPAHGRGRWNLAQLLQCYCLWQPVQGSKKMSSEASGCAQLYKEELNATTAILYTEIILEQTREVCLASHTPFACRHRGAVHVRCGQLVPQQCLSLHPQRLIRRSSLWIMTLH